MEKNIRIDDYPLLEKRPEIIFTPGGVNVSDITLENLNSGKISQEDCRTSRENLLYQAEVAKQVGNFHVARNFERAAEMVDIDGDRVIEIYNSLRPFRCTEEELKEIASELRNRYNAELCAKLIEESTAVLKKRGMLKTHPKSGG